MVKKPQIVGKSERAPMSDSWHLWAVQGRNHELADSVTGSRRKSSMPNIWLSRNWRELILLPFGSSLRHRYCGNSLKQFAYVHLSSMVLCLIYLLLLCCFFARCKKITTDNNMISAFHIGHRPLCSRPLKNPYRQPWVAGVQVPSPGARGIFPVVWPTKRSAGRSIKKPKTQPNVHPTDAIYVDYSHASIYSGLHVPHIAKYSNVRVLCCLFVPNYQKKNFISPNSLS